jgi:hypothetical protein
MISMSRTGSTSPSTWMTSASSNAPVQRVSHQLLVPIDLPSSSNYVRTIWKIPSTDLTLARKLFPSPAPLAAPLVNPAMSTQVRNAGISVLGL